MIKNYFKIAFRNILRHKAFATINILGLAIGMTCSIFIFLWVQDELSYDRFNKHADETFRILADASDFKAAVNCAGMTPELKARIPAVRNFVRLSHQESTLLRRGDQKFEEDRIFYVDSTFLDVFSYPLLKGNRELALQNPNAVVLTEAMAEKYFGDRDPMGKELEKDNGQRVVVTGVLADIPSNSHLQFDFLFPISSIAQTNRDIKTSTWDNFNFYGYLQLDPNVASDEAALARLTKQINDIYRAHVPPEKIKIDFSLQRLTAIHLHSNMQIDLPGHGNIQYVNIFFAVALFILIVACINFMNLATARSARRAKEVGLRKVVGAERRQLVAQFIGESILISFLSLFLAIGLVWLLLPFFNELAGHTFSMTLLGKKMLGIMIGMALVTGIISGSYPALYLSGFRPVQVLKGSLRKLGGNLVFRNALVVTQFVVSIVLLVGTAVVYKQLHYIRTMNLGFEQENLLYLPMRGDMWNKQAALKTELANNSLTQHFTITDDIPTNLTSGIVDVNWEGKDPNNQVVFITMYVDENFFDVFDMKMLYGRAFSQAFKSDSANYIINEKTAEIMGLKPSEAVGKTLYTWDNPGTIVGVVKDFNFKPIQQPIEPMILGLNRWGGYAVVRAQPGKTDATISALRNISSNLNPTYPFSFGFLDEDLANLYQGEQRMGNLFNAFAILAILISCMGLYGLSAFLAEQRVKEIGVRKVLGASISNIVLLLSGGFTRLILVAMLIAIPVAWYAVNRWLDGFAYRVHVGWYVFAAAALVALAIAWLTVSFESIKAAIANPVKALRSE